MNTTQNKPDPKHITAIATICQKLNIGKEAKAIMVEGFSNGRETSSGKLTYDEAKLMMVHMLRLQTEAVKKVDDPSAKMKGKIFNYCHDLGWTKISRKSGRKVADVARFDEWAVEKSYLKKKLNAYTYNELPKLVSQFEAVYRSFLKKI